MFNVTRSHDQFDLYTLSDTTADVHVVVCPARGGMITTFTVAGTPLLYMDQASLRDMDRSVHGGIPILFPIAGPLHNGEYTYEGTSYTLPQHGFARTLPWQVGAMATDDAASLTIHLASSQETHQHYPFDWQLEFTYRVVGSKLTIAQRFHNRSAIAMPFYAGLHPYFAVPVPAKATAHVAVEATRYYDVTADAVKDYAGTIDWTQPVDMDFLDHHRLGTELTAGGRTLKLQWSTSFANLVVWTQKDAPFICVEPYMAAHYAMNTGDGVIHLAANTTMDAHVSIELA